VDSELAAADSAGARLTTVLDSDYPANLRLIPNLPPFLFIQRWAQTYVAKRAAIEVGKVDEVIRHLAEPARVAKASEQRQQLAPTLFLIHGSRAR
jgi:DNA processing protein